MNRCLSVSRRQSVAILACGLFSCSLAFAQVTVNPSSPKALETVHLKITEGAIGWPAVDLVANGSHLNDYDPRATQVSMAGNRITVSVQLFDNEFGSPSQAMDLPLGQLPPGFYQVEVVRRLPDGTPAGTVGTTEFTVSARAAGDPLWNSTDLWWNENESGWGLMLMQHGSALFGSWFVYGADNKPIWYVIPGGTWTSPSEFRGSIYRTAGPYFGGASFDPSLVRATLVGQAVISFSSSDSNLGGALFIIDGETFFKSIRRQPF